MGRPLESGYVVGVSGSQGERDGESFAMVAVSFSRSAMNRRPASKVVLPAWWLVVHRRLIVHGGGNLVSPLHDGTAPGKQVALPAWRLVVYGRLVGSRVYDHRPRWWQPRSAVPRRIDVPRPRSHCLVGCRLASVSETGKRVDGRRPWWCTVVWPFEVHRRPASGIVLHCLAKIRELESL